MAKKKLDNDSKVPTTNDDAQIEKSVGRKELILEAKRAFINKGTLMPVAMFSDREGKPNTLVVFLKMAMRDPAQHDELINEILGDLVAGAYQDRSDWYRRTVRGNSNDGHKHLSKMRQSADKHLINVVKALRDIKRPPVRVVVQKAEQVNVAEQVNQGDQQVNIAKNEQPLK